ncbi:Mur ligase family protein, partial [SCandidatus Aminicenantes bacterium Aminicenantia_JdfR_composite]|nr:Mur ligase family protein [SCandidatus Aminicenantes bacterium Aminicenantia_JdfR_composite]
MAYTLQEAGYKVLARTTGTRPIIIYPDGQEKEIKRIGMPSILEGKRILKLSKNLKIDALVLEIMSISPECGYVESIQIFRPNILLITNIKIDHIAQIGESKEEMAHCYASYIPKKSTIFILEREFHKIFELFAQKQNAKLIKISEPYSANLKSIELPFFEFEENLKLALAVADFLKIRRDISVKGINKATLDFGHLKIWLIKLKSSYCYAVNCFA